MTGSKRLLTATALACLTVLLVGAQAQATGLLKPGAGPAVQSNREPLRGIAVMSGPQGGLAPGQEGNLVLVVGVNPGFHINSDQPPLDWLSPTKLVFAPDDRVEILKIIFPQAKPTKLAFAEEPLPVFDKMVAINLLVRVRAGAQAGQATLKGTLSYQACTDEVCLPPAKREFKIELVIGNPGTSSAQVENPRPERQLQTGPKETGPSPAADRESGSSGLLWVLISTFLGGLALNLTPCVYPVLPITVAYFGGQAASRAGLAVHGLAYLGGITISYTILGTFAALTGSLLGAALQQPAVLIGVAAILILLAGSMFGLFEFKLPSALNKLSNAGSTKRGYLGSLLMGLTLGLVAAPCIGPFTVGVLTFVAQRGDPVIGGAVFFALSLGLGLPQAVLGLFSSKILAVLPRSGPWMVWIRKLLGGVLIIMAIYLLRPLTGETMWPWLLAAGAAGMGLTAILAGRGVRPGVRLLTGLACFIVAGQFAFSSATDSAHWPLYTPAKLAAAKGQPVVLDFAADWCAPCRVLAENLADPTVEAMAERAVTLKVDLTDWESKEAEELRKAYRITGVPTLVFIDREGKEIKSLRAVGAISVKELILRFSTLLEK